VAELENSDHPHIRMFLDLDKVNPSLTA